MASSQIVTIMVQEAARLAEEGAYKIADPDERLAMLHERVKSRVHAEVVAEKSRL